MIVCFVLGVVFLGSWVHHINTHVGVLFVVSVCQEITQEGAFVRLDLSPPTQPREGALGFCCLTHTNEPQGCVCFCILPDTASREGEFVWFSLSINTKEVFVYLLSQPPKGVFEFVYHNPT